MAGLASRCVLRALRAPSIAAVLALGCGDGDDAVDAGLDGAVAIDAPAASDAPAALDVGRADAPRMTARPLTCAEATGSSIELLPVARLDAQGTRATVRSWAREDRDGPMALRNEVPDDGWLAAGGQIARLEIDLAPALGAPVRIDSVTMSLTSRPERVAVLVLEGCGGDVVRAIEDADPSAPIALDGACGACLVLEIEGASDTRMTSLSVTSRAELTLPAFEPSDPGPFDIRFPMSGVVEGFYGRPWSFAERRLMIERLAQLGMGLYLYAPKDDPLHRDRWREPYDEAFLASFRELGALGDRVGVRLIFGISPFLDINASSSSDLATLVGKIRAFLDAGADGVAILADDIELGADVVVDGALGAEHVRVTRHVRAEIRATHRDATILFVPTVYNDAQLDGHAGAPDYLRALTALEPDVEILWTGTSVASDALSGASLDRARALIGGRRLLLWDNLWSNDIRDPFGGQLLLAPYAGRDPALRDAVTGVLANPLIQGAAARLDVGHLGAWVSGDETSGGMRVASAILEAQLRIGEPSRSEDTLIFVSETFDGTFVHEPTHARALEAFEAVIDAGVAGRVPEEADVYDALRLLGRIAGLETEVHHSGVEPGLGDQLAAPLANASASAWEALMVMELLQARLSGEGEVEAERALDEATAARLRASRFTWGDGVVGRRAHQVRTLSGVSLGLSAPERSVLLPDPECVAGSTYRLYPGDRVVSVDGIRGALPLGEAEWLPPHAGRFVAVITRVRDEAPGGWDVIRHEVVCRPAR